MQTWLKTPVLAAVLIVFWSFSERLEAADFDGPREAGLGGAGRAAPLLNDAIFLNPSYASFINTYNVSANYQLDNAGGKDSEGNSEFHGHLLNLSVLDGRSDAFQAGLAFTRREDITFVHLSGSKAIIPERLSVGVAAKLGFPNDGSGEKIFDGMISATYVVYNWLTVSATGDNLMQSQDAVNHGLYREIAIGSRITLEGIAMIYLDPHYAPELAVDNKGFNLGVEIPLLSDFFFRLGKFNDSHVAFENAVGSGYGLGIGWVGPKISVDYGFQRVIQPLFGTGHVFGLTINI